MVAQPRTDFGAPSFVLPRQLIALERLAAASDRRTAARLRAAHDEVERAWDALTDGSSGTSLEYMTLTVGDIKRAQQALGMARALGGPDTTERIREVQGALADVAGRMATDTLGVARGAGVADRKLAQVEGLLALGALRAEGGNYVAAVALFGNGLQLAADTIVFDIDQFDQNLRDTFDDESVGYSYAITFDGQLYNGGHSNGLARTENDPPETDQAPNKPMHVASVSKMLTAILVMDMLEENGLSPQDEIAPWLPSDWTLGDGVEDLTFADLMTHHSGFAQNNPVGNDYAGLQDLASKDVGATGFQYSNTNFSMMRVLSARLQGVDPPDVVVWPPDLVAAAAFALRINEVYSPLGFVPVCHPDDTNRTIQYSFPDSGDPGYDEPARDLSCGGFGFFISAVELTEVMVNLRYTENLVTAESYEAMKDGFLGFNDPDDFSWSDGAFGVYYNHGGDWGHASGSLDACAMIFPIVVEVAVTINSTGGAYSQGSGAHQCRSLRDAFDGAWVAN
jgi:hypothetical protein